MARTVNKEALDQKIAKAQDDVLKAKKRYDAAAENLRLLLEKREAIRNDELIKAVGKSERSYEEIMEFLQGGSEE